LVGQWPNNGQGKKTAACAAVLLQVLQLLASDFVLLTTGAASSKTDFLLQLQVLLLRTATAPPLWPEKTDPEP
ncbi:hypothetical protein LZB87_09940, partial [Campylobacter coli]|nr:hypothetical protein [Campylobacter coli]